MSKHASNTSGRIKLHDPRSRKWAFPTRRSTSSLVSHRFDAPNLDQFYTSGCVGFSGANMLNCAAAFKSRRVANIRANRNSTNHRYQTNDDALGFYAGSTRFDPFDWIYPPTDEGSSALGLMKYWKELGIIDYYQWAFGFDAFLAALETQPVLVGTNWYSDMNTPSRSGTVFAEGEYLGGHEYLAVGFSRSQRRIRFENSWGESWGLRGKFYIHFEDFAALLDDGGDVAVPRFL